MRHAIVPLLTAVAIAAAQTSPVMAQSTPQSEERPDTMRQISAHMGEMTMTVEAEDTQITDALRFEPFQQLDEMFLRDDVVFLMRHGPTDWSKLDEKDVAPTNCDDQRVMSPEGAVNMRDLGSLMAANDVLPSRIVVSE